MIRISPSRIQTFFFILPLIRPILLTPSKQRTLIWFAPIISSAKANISRFLFRGTRTLTISSGPVPLSGFLIVSTSSPFTLLLCMQQVKKTISYQLYRITGQKIMFPAISADKNPHRLCLLPAATMSASRYCSSFHYGIHDPRTIRPGPYPMNRHQHTPGFLPCHSPGHPFLNHSYHSFPVVPCHTPTILRTTLHSPVTFVTHLVPPGTFLPPEDQLPTPFVPGDLSPPAGIYTTPGRSLHIPLQRTSITYQKKPESRFFLPSAL